MAAATPLDTSSFHIGRFDGLPIGSDTTTSRVIINNPALRVVIFAMDAGQQLTEHASPRAVVVQQFEGRLGFTVAGQKQTLTPGDIVYLAPGDSHALIAETPSRFSLVMIDVAETDTSNNEDSHG